VNITRREKQVLGLLADGNTAIETAKELQLSIHTVRSYTRSIVQKLGAKNATHAIVLYSIQENIREANLT